MNINNQQLNSNEHDRELDDIDQETLVKLSKLKAIANQVQPDRQFANLFRAELSNHVQERGAVMEVAQPASTFNQSYKKPLTFFGLMNKIIIPLVAVAIVASGTGYWYASQNGPALLGADNQLLSGKYAVTEVDENSFGELNKVNIIDATQAGANGNATGIGGNALAQSERAASAPTTSSSSPALSPVATDKMIAPAPEPYPCGPDCPISYKFKYQGKDLTGLSDEEPVLKRSKPEQPQSLVTRLLRMFSFGLIDLSKFQNTRMQAVSFMEDREYGLAANIDLNVGTINMYQNWEKWPQYPYGCYGYSCGNTPRLEPKDIPSDDELIDIAKQFMNDYQISSEGYGEPFVYDYSNWRVLYDQTKNKSNAYLPEQLNVIYPLVLEGQTVYDESGNKSGLNINIDVRSRKVSGLYGLDTKQYQKSAYKGETSSKRILEIAERGGYRNYNYQYPGKVVTLELGTPTIEMVRMWYTQDMNKQGEELYMPAYIFPIINAEQNNYWRKNVIVPLVRDILDNENQGYGYPTPLGDAGAGSSGSSEPAVLPESTDVPSTDSN